MSGRCLENVCKVSERCLTCIWNVFQRYLEGVLHVSERRLEVLEVSRRSEGCHKDVAVRKTI